MIGNILLGDLEQNNFSPQVNFQVFLFLNVLSWSRDMSRDQKFKMKEIGGLVANLVCLKKKTFLKKHKHN